MNDERKILERVLEEATGWARLFRDGTYGFKQPVPSGLVLEAMARAGILPDQG